MRARGASCWIRTNDVGSRHVTPHGVPHHNRTGICSSTPPRPLGYLVVWKPVRERVSRSRSQVESKPSRGWSASLGKSSKTLEKNLMSAIPGNLGSEFHQIFQLTSSIDSAASAAKCEKLRLNPIAAYKRVCDSIPEACTIHSRVTGLSDRLPEVAAFPAD